jgi:hypothetical protein
MKAKHVSGNLRRLYDNRAHACGYLSWEDFIQTLQLQEEEASEAMTVLKDMEQGDLDTIGRQRGD